MSRSYQNGPALIGAIFGTGTNGAYIDRTRTIRKLGEEKIAAAEKGGEDAGQYMVVNTEWGALDNDVSGEGEIHSRPERKPRVESALVGPVSGRVSVSTWLMLFLPLIAVHFRHGNSS